MCILDQSECMVLHAECTRMRCSAVESRYVTGFRRPSSMKVARDHIFSGLRAKNEIFNFCAQTGKYVVPGYVHAQSPADSDGVISFLSRAAEPGAKCGIHAPRIDTKYTYEFFARMHEKLNY